MKILVTAKRVPDPEQKVKIKDGALDLAGANFIVNPFDEYAVEAALRLTEKVEGGTTRCGEVTVLGIGPKDMSQQLRSCLAMGADRALLVEGSDEGLDSEQVARVIVAVYQRERPDLLLLGKQTVDGESNQVAQLVAGYLGLPQACFACSIEASADGKSVTVGREVDGGTETKRVPLPAVVTVDLRIVLPQSVRNQQTPASYAYAEGPRYASLKGIMASKKKPLDQLDLATLGVTAAPRLKLLSLEAPPQRQAGVKVESVDALIDKLRHEAKVI